MTGLSEAELLDTIDQAVTSHLLLDRSTDVEELYAFPDDQLPEVLAAGIASPRRRRYHRRAGQAIEAVYAERLEAHVEELAMHFDAADDALRAAVYELQAGRKTEAVFSWSQAFAYYTAALGRLDALGGHEAERAGICEALGTLCYTSGIEAPRAAEFLRRALSLYEHACAKWRAASVHTRLGLAYLAPSDHGSLRSDLAARHLAQACDMMAMGGLDAGLVTAETWLAIAQLALVDVPAAHRAAAWAVELAARLGERPLLVDAYTALGSALTWAGAVGEGRATLDRAWGMLEGQSVAVARDALAVNGIIVAECLRDPRLGLTWAARTTEARQLTALGRLVVPGYLTGIHALSGDLTAGRRLLTTLRQEWQVINQPEFASPPAAVSLLLLRLGDWEGAEALLEAGGEWARTSRYHWMEMLTALRLGEVFLEMGQFHRAAEHLSLALATAHTGGCVLVELGILPALVEAEVGAAELESAGRHLADAHTILPQHQFGAVSVLDAGAMDHHDPEQTEHIHQEVVFASLYLLADVVATVPTFPSFSPTGYRAFRWTGWGPCPAAPGACGEHPKGKWRRRLAGWWSTWGQRCRCISRPSTPTGRCWTGRSRSTTLTLARRIAITNGTPRPGKPRPGAPGCGAGATCARSAPRSAPARPRPWPLRSTAPPPHGNLPPVPVLPLFE